MKQLLLVVLVLFYLFVSCNSNRNKKELLNKVNNYTSNALDAQPEVPINQDKSIEIPFNTKEEKIILKDVHFKLLPDSIGVIGSFDKILSFDDRIFVLDKKSNSIFIFDKNWKFITKIQKIGKAKGEYLKLDDMAIDRNSNQIVVLSVIMRKLIHYNFKGDFLQEIRTPFWMREFTILPSGEYCYVTLGNNNSDYQVLLANQKGNIVGKSLKKRHEYKLNTFASGNTLIKKFDNQFLLMLPLGDKIFEINSTEIREKYVLNMGKQKFDFSDEYHKNFRTFNRAFGESNKYITIGEFIETRDYVNINLLYNNEEYQKVGRVLIYSKKNNKALLGNPYLIENKVTLPFPRFVDDNYFVSVVPAYWIKDHKEQLEKKYSLGDVLNNVGLMSNSILIYYKIKHF